MNKNLLGGEGEKESREKIKKLALTYCYYSVAFVLVHRVP